MSKLIRTLLVWLLVLALPAQGAMAATKVLCGPGHGHHAAASAAPADAHAHHAHGEPAAQAMPDAAVDPVDAALSAGSAGLSGQADTQQHKCSACASCCSASALLGSALGVPMWQPAPAVFIAVVPRVEAIAADGPDRPPRHILA